MGYASYYEDISEKYLHSVREVRAELERVRQHIKIGNEAESQKRLNSLRTTCSRLEGALGKLEKSLLGLVELATDPWISIAHRYFEDHNRLNKLESDTREFIEARKKESQALERAIESKNEVEIELRTRLYLLQDENRKLRKQNRTIKEDVLYRQNPKALFGAGVRPLSKK